MRMTESKPDDLKILHAKEFVRIFDDKILIILDWKENNYIRGDRYSPSKYLRLYKQELKLIMDTKCQPDGIPSGVPNDIPSDVPDDYQEVDRRETQIRLDKVREEKINIKKDINMQVFSKNDIEEIYQKYPTRCIISGRSTNKNQKNKDKIKLILKSKKPEELIKDIELFLEDRKKTNTYLPDFSKFLNNIPDPELYNSTPEVANIEEKDPYAGLAPWQIRDKKRDEEYLRELALMQKAEETRIRDQERTIAEMKRRGEWGTDKKTEETDEIWKNWE